MRMLFVLLLLLVPACGPTATTSAPRDPETTVGELFTDHFMHDMGFTLANVARKQKWLTPDLYRQIDAYFQRPMPRDEVPPIDGDPFTDTQDYPASFAVSEGTMDGSNAIVPVVMTTGPEKRTVKVKLVPEGMGWLVDDVMYEDGSTFRELLKEQP